MNENKELVKEADKALQRLSQLETLTLVYTLDPRCWQNIKEAVAARKAAERER